MPQDYIRKQTLANAERFITPELKEMESRVLSAQEMSISLEQEIFAAVRDYWGPQPHIQEKAVAVAELDVLVALRRGDGERTGEAPVQRRRQAVLRGRQASCSG